MRQSGAVSRDEAATALGLARTTAAFHLDRLVDEGLLGVEFARRTGRSGPGAGRPSKLYRRSGCQVDVSVPERRYELAARLLADAVAGAERSGASPRAVLDELGVDPEGIEAITVGGMVAELMGRVPRVGDRAEFRGLVLTVTQASPRRAERVEIHRTPSASEKRDGAPD